MNQGEVGWSVLTGREEEKEGVILELQGFGAKVWVEEGGRQDVV